MKKVLIVDDAVTVRMYHRTLMEQMDLQVSEAENGIEALERICDEQFDLLIVDINMPKMDGYRLLEEVRNNPDLQSTPVIMVSTQTHVEDQIKALAEGANFYIVKPADPQELIQAAELLLGL